MPSSEAGGVVHPHLAHEGTVSSIDIGADESVEKLRAGDQIVVGSTPAEAATVLAADSKKWGAVARRIQLGLD